MHSMSIHCHWSTAVSIELRHHDLFFIELIIQVHDAQGNRSNNLYGDVTATRGHLLTAGCSARES